MKIRGTHNSAMYFIFDNLAVIELQRQGLTMQPCVQGASAIPIIRRLEWEIRLKFVK